MTIDIKLILDPCRLLIFMTKKDQYVTGIALSQFVYGARSLGIDVANVMERVGLSEEYLMPSARVPENNYERVLLQLILANKNNSFGVDIGQQIMPPLYGVLMSLALSSPSLGEALKYLARYQGLATGNCGEVEYSFEDKSYQLSIKMTHQNPVVRRHISECVMTMFCSLLRLITARQDLSPDIIWLEHSPYSGSAHQHFESVVRCPVSWATGESKMILSEKMHHFPILGHGEEMLRIAEKQAQDQLEKINSRLSVLEKIQWHAVELMQSSMPRRETVAKRLQISTRTLDRRLEEAETSWQEMLDELRLQRAIEYLSDKELTVARVAEKLGFSEVRAFQRKFKVWTGLTPTGYRKETYKL
jgi:AraC-like DNA-binding protein